MMEQSQSILSNELVHLKDSMASRRREGKPYREIKPNESQLLKRVYGNQNDISSFENRRRDAGGSMNSRGGGTAAFERPSSGHQR
mmetsp:Transcript_7232/g.12213  ORF Transcript_7232/g.12213 Transcript_7232/m.12213 type:complete len:85 (-) Transcript_7232:172-426(-)